MSRLLPLPLLQCLCTLFFSYVDPGRRNAANRWDNGYVINDPLQVQITVLIPYVVTHAALSPSPSTKSPVIYINYNNLCWQYLHISIRRPCRRCVVVWLNDVAFVVRCSRWVSHHHHRHHHHHHQITFCACSSLIVRRFVPPCAEWHFAAFLSSLSFGETNNFPVVQFVSRVPRLLEWCRVKLIIIFFHRNFCSWGNISPFFLSPFTLLRFAFTFLRSQGSIPSLPPGPIRFSILPRFLFCSPLHEAVS